MKNKQKAYVPLSLYKKRLGCKMEVLSSSRLWLGQMTIGQTTFPRLGVVNTAGLLVHIQSSVKNSQVAGADRLNV